MLDLKKILSYLFPIRLNSFKSQYSGKLQINLVDGNKTLDTTKSNYSYGSLQRILNQGLKKIELNNTIKSILILGLGGGSVIETIRERFKSTARIDVVEIDQGIINIAINEFKIDRFQDLEIINDDAFNFVNNCKLNYDLIIVDLFIEDQIPEVFYSNNFLKKIADILNINGRLIYNLMRDTIQKKDRSNIIEMLRSSGLTISVYEKIENTNDLIIGEKRYTK